MNDLPPPLAPPDRLLCGPGPSNIDPRVLDAMQLPMLGHLDPEWHRILEDLVELLQLAYRRSDGLTIALSASGTSGMEAGLASLAEPGDTVIVPACGFFGNRMIDIARRHRLNVVELRAPFGKTVSNEQIMETLETTPEARLVAVVHAETSTGVAHPLAELGAPPGISPVTLSPQAMERIRSRTAPVPFSFDFLELEAYWIKRPAKYHHTTPNVQYYALYEGLRLALEEGLEARWQRHAEAGAYLQAALMERGFELLADPHRQLAQLTAVCVPESVDGKEVQMRMLREHNIEVGGGLGPDAPDIWRIGMMGTNAHIETADRLLEAWDAVVTAPRAGVSAGRS